MKEIFIVVPAYEPEEKIMNKFINELKKEFDNILIINDGSTPDLNKYFEKLEKNGFELFTHCKNFGKGRAIKNAFNYLLSKYPDIKGIVMCDCDGQHSVKDVKNMVNVLLENPDKLILGVRDFDKSNVPKKNMLGNKITREIFKLFIGKDITDTQTGLRGLSKELMYKFCDLNGERYEYETNMLIECQGKDIEIKEVNIDTIYIEDNRLSHFNPIKDSIRIYKMFFKYLSLPLSNYLLDIIIFSYLFNTLTINGKILGATIIARLISSIYNYIISKNYKFKHKSTDFFVKYYSLVLVQMFMSGCFTTWIMSLGDFNVYLVKIIVDIIIFIINIYMQNEIIFKGDNNEKE